MNTKTKEGARNKGNPYFLRVPWNKGGLVNTGQGHLYPVEYHTVPIAGFCRIMREENCQETKKNHMLDYLIALLDDTNYFLWQIAKASHAVLLCRMEQGEVTSWSDTEKN